MQQCVYSAGTSETECIRNPERTSTPIYTATRITHRVGLHLLFRTPQFDYCKFGSSDGEPRQWVSLSTLSSDNAINLVELNEIN